MKLELLDIVVDIYQSGRILYIVDRIGDTVTVATPAEVMSTLEKISNALPDDIADWLLLHKPDQSSLALCGDSEITDWRKIPRDAAEKKPVKPSEFLGE